MATELLQRFAPLRRLAAWGALLAASYQHLDRWTRRLLGALFKLAVLAYFIFCALFLVLRYAVLPNIDHYKANIEQLAGRALGQPVSIGTVRASWNGLRPSLAFVDVVIHDPQGRAALRLPAATATVSWWSLAAADLRLTDLEIIRPDLDIRREGDGKLYMAGIFIDPNKTGDGAGASWALSQRQIVIRDGRVRWTDVQRGAPELILENVNFVLHNNRRRHRLALQASPPAALAAPLDVRADFTHPRFAPRIADPARWSGDLYLALHDADLAAWKPYLDYPFELERGAGMLRAWLRFDHGQIADLTADPVLSEVSVRLAHDLPALNLRQISGRVTVREAYQPAGKTELLSFGRQGHTVELSNLSLQTEDGVILPATTISETFAVATKNQPARTRVEIRSLELQPLVELAEHLPLPAVQLQLLRTYAPRGRLQDFSAQWRGAWPDIASYAVKGSFNGFGLNSQPGSAATAGGKRRPATPGFENLTGSIDLTEKGGNVKLDSPQSELQLPGYLSQPVLPFEKLDLQARWVFPDEDTVSLQLDHLDFRQDGVEASFSGKHRMALHNPASAGNIELTGKISSFAFSQIGRYLPSATPQHLREWLLGALREGRATDVTLALNGDLAQFPFSAERPAREPRGEFKVTGKIENGSLNYTPGEVGRDGKSPEWPLLEQINGSFEFDRSRMQIKAHRAKTGNLALGGVSAVIPDLLSPERRVEIDGTAAGALQDMVGFVNQSPVLGWIGDFTEETKASGKATLALKLQLPLRDLHDSKVQGTLQFANNDVTLQNAIPTIAKASGKLAFDERGFELDGAKGEFLGGPVTLSGGSRADGTILVKAEGGLSADGVRNNWPQAAMRPLLQRVSGTTRYSATITVNERRPGIVVESDLNGIGLDFPAPLHKAANQPLPLKFQLAGVRSDDVRVARDEIRLALGSTIAAHYQRQRPADEHGDWRMVAGGIGVNVPAPTPEEGLLANLSMDALNIDAWRSIVASLTAAEPEKEAPSAGQFDLGQYFEPDVLAARATELIVMGKKLENVVVGASHQGDVWQVNLDSAQASGYVTWNQSRSGRTLGRVKARLTSLIIPQSAAGEVSDLLEGKNEATQIPALDIVADNFQLFGKPFGKLELAANNVRRAPDSESREWRIGKLAISNSDAELKGTGKWITGGGKSVSNLTYVLNVADAGKLLERFGFARILRGGQGKMEGEISWNGLPFSIDIPSLSGQLQLDLQAGQFLKMDPGAAKLLGVLSLQSLPRRLTLDFRDVFSEGFAFDGVVATATIAKGQVSTDNFKMRSVNATVLMDGSADLVRESQNLHVVVLPEINLGAASVVYALAINPVIGIGSFLAQLFLRDPLMQAFTFEYDIEGSWQDPKVVKLERGKREQQPLTGTVPAVPAAPPAPE